MQSPRNDITQERFPELEQNIREIEYSITVIRGVAQKLLPGLPALVERLNRLEGTIDYLSKIGKRDL